MSTEEIKADTDNQIVNHIISDLDQINIHRSACSDEICTYYSNQNVILRLSNQYCRLEQFVNAFGMDMFDKKLFSIVFCDDNTPNFKYSNLYIKDAKLPYLTVKEFVYKSKDLTLDDINAIVQTITDVYNRTAKGYNDTTEKLNGYYQRNSFNEKKSVSEQFDSTVSYLKKKCNSCEIKEISSILLNTMEDIKKHYDITELPNILFLEIYSEVKNRIQNSNLFKDINKNDKTKQLAISQYVYSVITMHLCTDINTSDKITQHIKQLQGS